MGANRVACWTQGSGVQVAVAKQVRRCGTLYQVEGFMQRYGLDYVEIFAPVLRYNTLGLVPFLVASNGWIIRQMDAFPVSIGFERCIKEVCLYIKRVEVSMVLLTVYVDGITITRQ
ncbi:Aste57867_25391 [Aphanomyces stellatus]|uniref:Aste57867_25391 protein n=1 Tax=Aphanomyces stellatus TaxID=120398 RepID=A0A485LT47_9STRA|nr:hypothetical protein As57867_025312 [Aphanomyces stellatus]VFU02015.1 Aste57867_25391 [Aphanomyces stellatus]